MFIVLSSWQSHCESSPGSYHECRMAPSGRRPKTEPDDVGYESACTGCQKLHPLSPFIIITQPESWYSFYRPTEGRRLSRPSWLITYRDGLPVHRRSPILVLTGSDVAQLYVDRGQRVTTKPNRQTIYIKRTDSGGDVRSQLTRTPKFELSSRSCRDQRRLRHAICYTTQLL